MWNFVVCFLCILQVLCQDTILQNPANSKVTSEDTILSNPNLTPTTLSNGKVEQVSSAPVPENEMAAGEDLSQNTTPFNPQDMVLSNPSATSQDTTLSNPTPAPMDMVLSNPAATSQDTTLSNAPMDIILSNPAATTQDTVISNQIIPSQLDTLISNPNVAPPASANSTAQDSSISNIAATPPFQGSATTGNNVKLDGRTSLSGPVTSSASASCENTKNECVCKSQWLFALGSGIVHEGCANPDEDPAGLWCVIDQKSCSVLNPNLFQMLDSRRDPVDWFGTTEYIDYCNPRCAQSSMGKPKCTVSKNGCNCKDLWTYETPFGTGTFRGCVNVDNDINGDWCKIDESKCADVLPFLGTTSDTFEYFDYCGDCLGGN